MKRWHTADKLGQKIHQDYRFIARQPIFDRSRNTFGYELLFRCGWENFFSSGAEQASRSIIDSTLAFGMDSLVGGSGAFINCTYDLLVQDVVSLLPAGTVLEILETVEVDDALIAACHRLVASGYFLALDDFDFDSRWDSLLPLASFIKVDFRASSPQQRIHLITKCAHMPVRFIAEKVEGHNEFQDALNEGFHFFQGYFFMRPVVVARPALASVVQRFRLLSALHSPELKTPNLLQLLKTETSIALRVLRLANTASAGPRAQIMNVRTALAMIGHEKFRKLALGALMAEMAGDHTVELHQRMLQRGRFCELMADELDLKSDELFFFGILSVIKPLLELTQTEIADMLTLDEDLMEALEGGQNRCQVLMRSLIDFERADWVQFSEDVAHLHIPEKFIADCCRLSQQWAFDITSEARLAA